MALQPQPRPWSWWLWAALPVVTLSAAFSSTYAIDAVLRIGPFDRAWLGWMITIPLILISPWLAAQAAHRAGTAPFMWLAVMGPAILAAATITISLALSAHQIDCEPVTNPLQALPRTLIVGAATAFVFAAVAWSALQFPRQQPLVALLVSAVAGMAGIFVVLMVAFGIAFPAVSCHPPL